MASAPPEATPLDEGDTENSPPLIDISSLVPPSPPSPPTNNESSNSSELVSESESESSPPPFHSPSQQPDEYKVTDNHEISPTSPLTDDPSTSESPSQQLHEYKVTDNPEISPPSPLTNDPSTSVSPPPPPPPPPGVDEPPPPPDAESTPPPLDTHTPPPPPDPEYEPPISPPPPDSPPSSGHPPPPPSTPSETTPPPTDDDSVSTPKNESPPPPSTTSPPPASANGTTHLPRVPVFPQPRPGVVTSQTPPPPPPIQSPNLPQTASSSRSSGLLVGSLGSQQSSVSTTNAAIIAGIVAGGAVFLALIIICLLCLRRRKKTLYVDPEHPPRGGDQYYNGSSTQENSTIENMAKLPSPPGVMRTPVVRGDGGGGVPTANSSSDFSSSYSGPHPTVAGGVPTSPNTGGIGAKSQFTYEELAAATDGFSPANLLGQGGFGFVHKGRLPDGMEVAVKSLKSGSGQGEREFQAEVEIISRVHHRHLVSLVGYCIAGGHRMLVYEFVPNKTLELHLHGKGQPVMNWATRIRIAVGAAKGLAYLHEDCHPRIIHRDIKAANILLDFNFEAMVADFGLAKLTSDNFTHVSTRVMGTFGYLAPEYASTGKLTEKSDVFSYGVTLLELITGRRPVDRTNKTMEDSLVDWARPLLSKALEDGNYNELVDPRLEDNYIPHEIARMVACAAASIRHSARRRPKMSQILRTLVGDSLLEDLNESVKANQSDVYNSCENTQAYDTCAYNADMLKFKKMVMSSQEFNSSEYGVTSDQYGLNASSSSSECGHNPSSSSGDSREMLETSSR